MESFAWRPKAGPRNTARVAEKLTSNGPTHREAKWTGA